MGDFGMTWIDDLTQLAVTFVVVCIIALYMKGAFDPAIDEFISWLKIVIRQITLPTGGVTI